VFDELAEGRDILQIGKFEMPSRAYIGRFNFKGADQQKIVGKLSGGERGRLHLAKTLMTGGNVLLLDEPSNDLDVETLRALEDALLEFAGSALIISHDRWFLDRICTHILAAEGDSQWSFFTGNYQEYEEDKKKRLGEEGAKPKRIRARQNNAEPRKCPRLLFQMLCRPSPISPTSARGFAAHAEPQLVAVCATPIRCSTFSPSNKYPVQIAPEPARIIRQAAPHHRSTTNAGNNR